MARHTVGLNIKHGITVQKVDVELPVTADGRLLGTVRISKGGIDWVPAYSRTAGFALGWKRFDKLMRDNGRAKT